jgi:hypothetical protein
MERKKPVVREPGHMIGPAAGSVNHNRGPTLPRVVSIPEMPASV